jgi:hypothetical protein
MRVGALGGAGKPRHARFHPSAQKCLLLWGREMGDVHCINPYRTVSRWIKRASQDPEPARRWLTFLHNHREAIAAMDFFTVPTITWASCTVSSLSVMTVGASSTSNVTRHPTSTWVVQQLQEAFPYQTALRFLIGS